MKRTLKYIIFLLFTASLNVACTFEEENIFGESAAVRMDKILVDYNTLLCDADNGWIMEYFPTDTTEGYTFWMKFHTSTKVEMIAQNSWTGNLLIKDSCVFDLTAENGPVLSFPVAGNYVAGGTKVGIFHMFANPQDPEGKTTALDGYGLQGDYEFIVMKAKSNLFVLKGKKRNTTIYLRKLSQAITPQTYLADVENMRNLLYKNNNHIPLTLIAGTDSFSVLNNMLSYGKFVSKYRIYKPLTDPLITGQDHSFIVTPSGIRFHTPFANKNSSFQTFEITEDLSKLVCKDSAANAFIVGPDPLLYFNINTAAWNFDFTKNMGSDFKAVYDLIVLNCQTKYKEKFTKLSFKFSTVRNSYTLTFVSGTYTGSFDFAKSIVNNQVVMTYAGTYDVNAGIYLKNIQGFNQLLTLFSSPFIVTPICGLNLTELKLKSTTNSNISFILNK